VIQISAAVNPGNSGGPALVADKIVGIVQSYAAGTQNIGYIIPNEEIDIFLANLKNGRYAGKATDISGTVFQSMENAALRRMLKVDAAVKGVLVHPPCKPAADYPLKPFDIVTRIGEHEIDDTGKVQLANGRRAPFQYLIAKLAVDNRVPLTVWRGGQQMRVPYPVTTRDTRLLRSYAGEPLAYFIHGPLVFAAAKAEDVSLYSAMNRSLYGDNSPLITRWHEAAGFPGEELVVVSAPMFKHKLVKGYLDPVGKVVSTVNGTRIKNLSHLVQTLRDCKDEFVTLRFADEYSEVLVFDRQAMEQATEEILEDHGISSTRRGSAELLKLWKAKPAPPG
jgi:PDZ domain